MSGCYRFYTQELRLRLGGAGLQQLEISISDCNQAWQRFTG